ncbi:hypothetical protein BDU57DRAFT_519537 [Ampelomyces quisqualis]|uniref:Uncharacterized protein n=1 Tax=Ampelomyces quisqualis TaxID=50730 RepID=A0A6A5QI43_AMPQU|nr:hypothetical protein BDU57DRAFT_519537 [Ampelomyces quisqualis]
MTDQPRQRQGPDGDEYYGPDPSWKFVRRSNNLIATSDAASRLSGSSSAAINQSDAAKEERVEAISKVLAIQTAFTEYLDNPDECNSSLPSLCDIDDDTLALLAGGQRYAGYEPGTVDLTQEPYELRDLLHQLFAASRDEVKVLQTQKKWLHSYIVQLLSDRLTTIDRVTANKILSFFQNPAPESLAVMRQTEADLKLVSAMKTLDIVRDVCDHTAEPIKDALEEIRVAKAQLDKERAELTKEKAEFAAEAKMSRAPDSKTTHNHISQVQTGTNARQYNYFISGSASNYNSFVPKGDSSLSKIDEFRPSGNGPLPSDDGPFPNGNSWGLTAPTQFTSLAFRTRPPLPTPLVEPAATEQAQPTRELRKPTWSSSCKYGEDCT